MPHISDLKRAALETLTGQTGHINDLEKAWLLGELSASEPQNINDLWNQYLVAQGAGPGHTGDMLAEWLIGLGYAGSVSDMLAQMWAAGGPALPFAGTVRADFESGFDLTVGGGVLTGTTTGVGSVHDGLLDYTGGFVTHVKYAQLNNFQPTTILCVNSIIRPDYTGNPASNQHFWNFQRDASDSRNGVWLQHQTTGGFFMWIRHTLGYYASTSLGAWSPTSGQDYEIELNMDLATGASRVFIDGTQLGATNTATGTLIAEAGNVIWLGKNPTGANTNRFSMLDFKVYDSIQHTADY